MRCETAHENLKAFCDGELGRLQDWRIERHLRHCTDCAAQRTALQRLDALLLAADIVDRDPAVASASPASMPQRSRASVTLRLIGGVAVTAALILGLLILPRSHRNASLAAEVRQALQNVNTWHLKGWKLLGGKRVPWEAWRQQTPYFYYERTGDDITLDDGAQRLRLIRADPMLLRSKNILLRTASGPDKRGMNAEMFDGELVVSCFDAEWWRREVKPVRETRDQAIFEYPGGRSIVDKRTRLPVQLEWIKSEAPGKPRQTVLFLRAEYDVPLPTDITYFSWPKDAQIVDTLTTPTDASIPHKNTVSIHGMTAQVTLLGMDAQGVILLRVRGWLGNVPLETNRPVVGLTLSASVVPSVGVNGIDPPASYDDRGRPYIMGGGNLGNHPDDKEQLLRLIPVEPLPEGAPRPRTLTLVLSVAAGVYQEELGENMMFGRNLYVEQMTWRLPLPERIAPIDLDSYMNPNWREDHFKATDGHIVSEEASVESGDDAMRAHYYTDVIDPRDTSGPSPAKLRRAVYWQERAISSVDPHGNRVQMLKLTLAQDYYNLHDVEQGRRICREMIAACDQNPDLMSCHRENAVMLLHAWHGTEQAPTPKRP